MVHGGQVTSGGNQKWFAESATSGNPKRFPACSGQTELGPYVAGMSTEQAVQTNEITVVDGDDWLGLYVNGDLKLQGHGRSRHADILAFGAEYAPYTVSLVFADVEWLHEEGQLPEVLSEVKVESTSEPRADLAAQ